MAFVKGQPFIPQFNDPATGLLMANGSIEFYLTGTTTPTPYYTDSSGTEGGTSLTLNAGGRPPTDIFYNTSVTYKLVEKDASGATLRTIDPYSVPEPSSGLRAELIASGGSALITHDEDSTTYNLATYLQNRHVRHVEDFGAVGDGALTGAAQEGTGTGTDDSTAIQNALNWVRDTGGKLEFDGTKVYRCDSALSLLRNSTTGPTQYYIEFNGAALDFSNLATGDYLHVGADSLANIATDVGHIRLANGRIFGQQTGNPGSGTAATNTATTGLKLEYAYNVILDHMIVHRCYIGLDTYYVFPLLDLMSSFKRNVVGVYVDDVTNDSTWLRTEAAQCRFGLVAQPQGVLDNGKCVNNRFDGFRAEGCEVGMHLDTEASGAGVAVLRDWHIDNPYFAACTYDFIRMGTNVDITTSSTRGTDSTGRIYGMRIQGGNWGITPSATKAALVFSGNNNVRQFYADIPVNAKQTANYVVNTPRNGKILFSGQADADSDAWLEVTYATDGTEYTTPKKSTFTFTAADTTPSIKNSTTGEKYCNLETDTGTLTITDFDDGDPGDVITVISRGAITFDAAAANLNIGTASIVTASGDITQWLCEDGTTWNLLGFVDMSANNSSGA